MRRLTALALAICMICLTATAAAATSRYKGDVDPSGTLSFQVEKQDGKQKVAKLKWTGLPVDCGGKPGATSGNLTFKVPVKKGAFHAKAVLGDSADPDAKANIHGTLTGKTASGTIALSGSALPLDGGNPSDCLSGKLNWSASR